jgi:hypothetical protein
LGGKARQRPGVSQRPWVVQAGGLQASITTSKLTTPMKREGALPNSQRANCNASRSISSKAAGFASSATRAGHFSSATVWGRRTAAPPWKERCAWTASRRKHSANNWEAWYDSGERGLVPQLLAQARPDRIVGVAAVACTSGNASLQFAFSNSSATCSRQVLPLTALQVMTRSSPECTMDWMTGAGKANCWDLVGALMWL